ncbi:MAG: hypothetical protein P4L79_05940 [Legionella sp.]|uniref:hypothetical protein n=1 Tax=Legionella sp. TaxID=459 RepID=UPI00284453EC|nr:hypothetical protein [Legionella sp.]
MTKRKVDVLNKTQDFPRKKTRYDINAVKELYASGLLLARQRKFNDAFHDLKKAYEMCIDFEQNIDDSDSNDMDEYFAERYVMEDKFSEHNLFQNEEENEDLNYEFKKMAALTAFRLSGLFLTLFLAKPEQTVFIKLSNYKNESSNRLQELIAHVKTPEIQCNEYIYYLASNHENFAFACNKLNRFDEETQAHLTSSAYYLQVNQLSKAIQQAHLAANPKSIFIHQDEQAIALEKVYKIYQHALRDNCQEVIALYADKILGVLRDLCNTLLNASKYELATQYLNELYQHAIATKSSVEIAEIALMNARALEQVLNRKNESKDISQQVCDWADKAEQHYRHAASSTFDKGVNQGIVKALFIKGSLAEEYPMQIQVATEALYREAQTICSLIGDEENLTLANIKLGKCLQLLPGGLDESIQLLEAAYYYHAHKVEVDDSCDGLSLGAGLAAYYLGISYLRQASPKYDLAAHFFREAFNYLPFSDAADFSFDALTLVVLLSFKQPTPDFQNSWRLLLEQREEFHDIDIDWELWLGCTLVELSNETVAKSLDNPEAISYLRKVLELYEEYIDLEYEGNDEMIIVLSQILAIQIGNGYKLLNNPVRAEKYYSYSEQFINRCQPQDALLARIELMQSRNLHQHISPEDLQKLKCFQENHKEFNEDRVPEFNLNKGGNFNYRANKVYEAQHPYQCRHFFFQLYRAQDRESLTDLVINCTL